MKLPSLLTLTASLLLAAPSPAQPLNNPEFLDQYAATNRFRLGNPTRITVTPDGSAVLFLRSGPRSFVQDLYLFDLASASERVLLTADAILGGAAEQLTPEELARRERMRMASRGIASFSLSDDGSKVLVPLSGRLFVIDLAAARVGSVKPVELAPPEGSPIDPQFSPDARSVACVLNSEVWTADIASGKWTRATSGAAGTITNGEAEFVAQEEMSRFHGYWWAPDSTRIAYQTTDTAGMEVFHIADAFNPGKAPQSWPYPRAGKHNAAVSLAITPITGGTPVRIQWDTGKYPYLASARWPRNAPLTILVQNRLQTEQVLLAVDDATGQTTELLREADPAWINIEQACPKWSDDGSRFLWLSEQAFPGCDFWTLQVRARDGSLIGNVAGKGLGILDLVAFDQNADAAILSATGGNPTRSRLYRVPLSGQAQPLLYAGSDDHPGNYGGVFGKSCTTWVRTYNTLDGRMGWDVVAPDGKVVGELASAAEQPPFIPNVELVTTTERLKYHCAIIRPRDFDPTRTYPVIDAVYGGPGSNTVTASARAYLLQQWLADQGFIVVAIDGRGTPRRGRAWERLTKHDLISAPLTDHAEALRNLAHNHKGLDLTRVGVTGWSFGGYFAAHATMRMPDLFKCGVVGAPVADWADYDTHYTERYMGLPQEHTEAYSKTNVLTYCKDLRVPLLIVHGTADDNVYFLHSLKLTDALFRAGRDFEFLPLAGFTHSPQEPAVVRRIQERTAGFLIRHLRP
jgi:dipeptidyl-peptidase 4